MKPNRRERAFISAAKKCALAISLITVCASGAHAQTNTFPSSGNAGVGTTTPQTDIEIKNASHSTLTINSGNGSTDASVLFQRAGVNKWFFQSRNSGTPSDSFVLFDAVNNAFRFVIDRTGNVGIGTTSPGTRLDVIQPNNVAIRALSNAAGSWAAMQLGRSGSEGSWGVAAGPGQFTTDAAAGDVVFRTETASQRLILNSGSGASTLVVSNGNVGIGTTSPQNKLHVTGNITVDGNINAKYQDVAEWTPASQQFSAGTVVVLDPNKSNHVIASTQAYDTRVAGVVSAQPGITLGEGGQGKVLVAATGRLSVNVDASRGAILIGDLLVTSDIPGVAMKSDPVNVGGIQLHRPGTLIGKALEPLEKGSGQVLVLLSLQ